MVIRQFLLFVLGVSCLFSAVHAQEKGFYRRMLEDGIKIAQRPHTAGLLRDYLRPVEGGADTLTVFFLEPMACPSCEAIVKPAIQRLRQVRPQETVAIVAVYDDVRVASDYMDRAALGENARIVDASRTFDKVFSTAVGGLQGVFVTRIDRRAGRMITGGTLSYVSVDFFRDFLSVREPFPFGVYDGPLAGFLREVAVRRARVGREGRLKYQSFVLDPDTLRLTQIRHAPVMRGCDLLFVDEGCNGGLHFTRDDRSRVFHLEDLLRIDSAVRDTFIHLPPAVYRQCRSEFHYDPLDIALMPEGGVALSYTLPRVELSGTGEEQEMGFWNECVFLYRKPGAHEWSPLVTFSNDTDADWMEWHDRIFPLRPGYVAMFCYRLAWPEVELADTSDVAVNPFLDGFYNRDNPYALEMELATGRITRRFGQLEPEFRQTLTGYRYSNLVADTHRGRFIYGNPSIGRLYLTDAEHPEHTLRTYEVFHVNGPLRADTARFYDESYYLNYAPCFGRVLEQVTLDDHYINCLVRTGRYGSPDLLADLYEFVRLSRDTGQVVERYFLKPEDEHERVLAYGLTGDDTGNGPFYLSKKEGRYWLRRMGPQ